MDIGMSDRFGIVVVTKKNKIKFDFYDKVNFDDDIVDNFNQNNNVNFLQKW